MALQLQARLGPGRTSSRLQQQPRVTPVRLVSAVLVRTAILDGL